MPWNFGVSFFHLFGYLVGGLANDDEVQFYRPDGPGIVPEVLKFLTPRKSLDFCNRIQDVTNTFFPRSRRQGQPPARCVP